MSDLQVWSEFFQLNKTKAQVNIVQLEDKSFWFQFSHLAKLLGYSNPTVALQTHCEDYEIQKLDIGKHELVNFVSESGFYSLVLGSQKPVAREFKKWVCSEILPKLRSQGLYVMKNHDESLAEYQAREAALIAENERLKNQRVTMLNFANNTENKELKSLQQHFRNWFLTYYQVTNKSCDYVNQKIIKLHHNFDHKGHGVFMKHTMADIDYDLNLISTSIDWLYRRVNGIYYGIEIKDPDLVRSRARAYSH